MFVEVVALVFTLFAVYYLFFEFSGHNLPPGPRPWPIVGNLKIFGKDPHLRLTELGKKYGNIFRVYVGHNPVIILSGDAIKEAFVRQPRAFAGRPPVPAAMEDTVLYGPLLVMMDYDERWKIFRKLGHSTIKVYGEDRLERVICKEVDELCKRLEDFHGKPLDISKQLGMSVTNVICTKIFGLRYDIDDPEFLKVYEIHDRMTRQSFGNRSIADAFPILGYIIPTSKTKKELTELTEQRYSIVRKKYLEHVETFDAENIRDYTDALLKAKQQAEEEDKSSKEHLQEGYIIMAGLSSLFIAGSETTSTTLSWAINYLLHNPEVQDRLHKEIDDVIGPDEFPKLSSRKELPVLEAFTAETHRLANLLPVGVPHKTTTDTTLLGYNIPEGTTVMANLWALHHDPTIWKDPFKFNLDRFLNDEGKFQATTGGTLLPFGAGSRVCVGEVLARSELFVFLCRLVQQFKFVNPPGCDLPSLEGESGIVLHPKEYSVCVMKRD